MEEENEYKELVESLVLNNKIQYSDIPFQLRKGNLALFYYAVRVARDSLQDAAQFVSVMEQFLLDIDEIEKQSNVDVRLRRKALDAITGAETIFTGIDIFEKLILQQDQLKVSILQAIKDQQEKQSLLDKECKLSSSAELHNAKEWLIQVEDWILCEKIRLVDMSQQIRITNHSVYLFAFRINRDRENVERYVEDLRILVDDLLAVQEEIDQKNLLEEILWSGMYFGEGYFKGEELFDVFVYEQTKAKPSLFRHAGLPFPNRYVLK
ncbi:hypothetical protein A5819_003696 [Enterococcus sp. 7E2_DIV0204]|uniref:hypothetical protein n=1 Tax=unclassified Enterococcus TaxID=2608891 RepID=UPI000A34C793|nr:MULTISPECIES: hypothetical protein [unclassified Enterococcus]OTN83877.1 hypothetical protein A5819_003696 [Enterococcus sp. 7E2_DIV0204]OTP47559.1 hypothetical protein A5884_003530 [Enterococcus sp. 7D2_DIV0200]